MAEYYNYNKHVTGRCYCSQLRPTDMKGHFTNTLLRSDSGFPDRCLPLSIKNLMNENNICIVPNNEPFA